MVSGLPDWYRLIRVDVATKQIIKPELSLIPACYYDFNFREGYSDQSGGSITISEYSLSGTYWSSAFIDSWIEFEFYGTAVGIVFERKQGKCDVYIDGEFIESIDVAAIKGSIYNAIYLVSESLEDKAHTIRVVVKDTALRIIGIVADSRKNYGILRQWPYDRDEYIHEASRRLSDEPESYTIPDYFYTQLWGAASVGAGSESVYLHMASKRHLTLYVEVDGPVNVEVRIYDGYNWSTLDTISFTAAGYQLKRYSFLACMYLRLRVDAGVTITANAYAMT